MAAQTLACGEEGIEVTAGVTHGPWGGGLGVERVPGTTLALAILGRRLVPWPAQPWHISSLCFRAFANKNTAVLVACGQGPSPQFLLQSATEGSHLTCTVLLNFSRKQTSAARAQTRMYGKHSFE